MKINSINFNSIKSNLNKNTISKSNLLSNKAEFDSVSFMAKQPKNEVIVIEKEENGKKTKLEKYETPEKTVAKLYNKKGKLEREDIIFNNGTRITTVYGPEKEKRIRTYDSLGNIRSEDNFSRTTGKIHAHYEYAKDGIGLTVRTSFMSYDEKGNVLYAKYYHIPETEIFYDTTEKPLV